MKDLTHIVAAMSIVELVHNAFEVWGMRQKVQWLNNTLNKRPVTPWPIHIDTVTKTIGLHVAILAIVGGSSFLILRVMGFGPAINLIVATSVLGLNYILTTWKVDSFHTEISQVMNRIKKRY